MFFCCTKADDADDKLLGGVSAPYDVEDELAKQRVNSREKEAQQVDPAKAKADAEPAQPATPTAAPAPTTEEAPRAAAAGGATGAAGAGAKASPAAVKLAARVLLNPGAKGAPAGAPSGNEDAAAIQAAVAKPQAAGSKLNKVRK